MGRIITEDAAWYFSDEELLDKEVGRILNALEDAARDEIGDAMDIYDEETETVRNPKLARRVANDPLKSLYFAYMVASNCEDSKKYDQMKLVEPIRDYKMFDGSITLSRITFIVCPPGHVDGSFVSSSKRDGKAAILVCLPKKPMLSEDDLYTYVCRVRNLDWFERHLNRALTSLYHEVYHAFRARPEEEHPDRGFSRDDRKTLSMLFPFLDEATVYRAEEGELSANTYSAVQACRRTGDWSRFLDLYAELLYYRDFETMSRVFASKDRLQALIALYKAYTFLFQTPFFPERVKNVDEKWPYYMFCQEHFKNDIATAEKVVPNIWKAFDMVLATSDNGELTKKRMKAVRGLTVAKSGGTLVRYLGGSKFCKDVE